MHYDRKIPPLNSGVRGEWRMGWWLVCRIVAGGGLPEHPWPLAPEWPGAGFQQISGLAMLPVRPNGLQTCLQGHPSTINCPTGLVRFVERHGELCCNTGRFTVFRDSFSLMTTLFPAIVNTQSFLFLPAPVARHGRVFCQMVSPWKTSFGGSADRWKYRQLPRPEGPGFLRSN